MILLFLGTSLALAGFQAAPAIAASTPAPAPIVAAAKPARASEIVCRRDRDRSLGSNMPGPKVCHTRSEWAEIAAATRRTLQTLSDRSISPTPIRGGH